jgi:hypothetical protein
LAGLSFSWPPAEFFEGALDLEIAIYYITSPFTMLTLYPVTAFKRN